MRNIQLKPTMIKIGVFVACGALAAGTTLVVRSGVLKGARCAALGEREQTRLTDYAHMSQKLPPTAALELAKISYVDSTCYRKLEFESRDPRRRTRLVLYASPDLRFLSRELLDSRVDPSEQEQREQQVLSAGLTQGNFPVLGAAGAAVTLTVFSDFQCPYCARLAVMLNQDVLPAEDGKVRVVFRHFPLPMHRWALAASEAAACAQEQGNQYFWALHDFIFEHQRELSTDNLKERLVAQLNKQPGLDIARFEACILEQRTVTSIEKDLAFGREIGVQGTPTVFVNAHRVGSVSSAEQIRSLIRQAGTANQRASAR